MKCFEIKYDSLQPRSILMDSSKTSLKAILLLNGNILAPVRMGRSVSMKKQCVKTWVRFLRFFFYR